MPAEARVLSAVLEAFGMTLTMTETARSLAYRQYTSTKDALVAAHPILAEGPGAQAVIRLDWAAFDLWIAGWMQSLTHALAAAAITEEPARAKHYARLAYGGSDARSCQPALDAYEAVLADLHALLPASGQTDQLDELDEWVIAVFTQCWDGGLELGADLIGDDLHTLLHTVDFDAVPDLSSVPAWWRSAA
jgi:hypothetical protein